MILGSLSGSRLSGPLLLVGLTFALGFGVGAIVGPVSVGRTAVPESAPSPLPPAPVNSIVMTRGVYSAEVLRVFDGDTFEARVRIWPGLDVTTKVRLRGIDAPEMRARCGEERVKAQAAREALQAMLDEGDVAIARVSLDKYGGRVVAAAATRATADVSAALLAKGLAHAYDGGRRETWCADGF